MFKLDPEVNAALMELFEMVVDLNCRTPHDFFFHFSGHVDNFSLSVHEGGWKDGERGTQLTFAINLDHSKERVLKELATLKTQVLRYAPTPAAKRPCPLKFKKRKPLLVIHPRRVGKTAAAKGVANA